MVEVKPTWERGNVRLYLGDCRAVLPHVGKVDACVTDPPFGIGFKYESHDDTPDGYGKWIWSCVEMAESKCSPGSPVFIWQAMLNAPRFSQWFPREWRVFAAAKNWVQIRPTAMQYSFDPVLVWWTPGEAWSHGTASRDFHIANTNPSSRTGDNHVPDHPCPRPLEQVTHIIRQWVKPGSVALDFCMGSGTTGVAAVQTGRSFIGIEIDPTYFEIAVRRIDKAIDAGALFAPVPPAVREVGLFGGDSCA